MARTALVTGGSNGIGKAMVLALAEEGIQVHFSYCSDHEAAKETAKLAQQSGVVCTMVQADLAEEDGVQKVFDSAMEQLGKIDILCNNAGVFAESTLLNVTPEQYARTMQVIAAGTLFLTQRVAGHMIQCGIAGRIINTSSAVTKCQKGQPVDYCMAKAAVNILTRCAAQELGPYGITCNAILPGAIPTKLNRWQFEDPKIREDFRSGSVLHQLGDAAYIAEAVRYLISPNARWTTGVLLSVDGGFTLN